MKEKTPCEELGYKVGDEFIILQKDACGFVKGQTVKLYSDDGSGAPLFQGSNNRYKLCAGQEGAYLALRFVTKVVKEGEMKGEAFNLKTNPWLIRVTNEQEYNAARKWLDENFGYYLDTGYATYMVGLTNTDDYGEICSHVMWMNEDSLKSTERYEIKLSYKTVVDSVTFPEVKTEQQKQIEELEKTTLLAQQQIETLKKGE